MLHINKLIINNFRPYHEETIFDFSNKNGLTLILGENGTGKSSVIKALKFVLYEELENFGDFKLKNEINTIGWEQKKYEFNVSLEFSYNESLYVLKRSVKLKPGVKEPKSDTDFLPPEITFIENGKFVLNNKAFEIIKNIIPTDISEFILFEGETISKYEDLLRKNQNSKIHDSIKRILGVNLLTNLVDDFKKCQKKINTELDRVRKIEIKNEKKSNEIDKLNEEIENAEKDIKKFKFDLKNYEQEKEKLDEYLNSNNEYSKVREEISEIDSKNKVLNNKKESSLKNIKSILKDYKVVCSDLIIENQKEVPKEIKKIELLKNNNKKYENELEIFIKIMSDSQCCYCDNKELNKPTIQSKIDDLKAKISNISDEDSNRLFKYETQKTTLEQLSKKTVWYDWKSKIKELEAEISSCEIEIGKNQKIINEKEQKLKYADGPEQFKENQKLRDNYLHNIFLTNKSIEELTNAINSRNDEKKTLVSELDESIELKSMESKATKIDNLIKIVNSAIDKYTKKMRIKVQEEATTMFRKISQFEEYDKLVFSEKYKLSLIDKKGRTVPNPSKGYMALITLSLIYGLHKNSNLTGTIILDAPFSSLTDFHRDKIIDTFNALSPQVILLAYNNQINIDKLRETMSSKLINEFEIYKDEEEENYIYKTKLKRVTC